MTESGNDRDDGEGQAPKAGSGYVGRSVYDGTRPLTPRQLEDARETVRRSEAAEAARKQAESGAQPSQPFGAWLTSGEHKLPDDFDLDV